jgi:hypothetical protein
MKYVIAGAVVAALSWWAGTIFGAAVGPIVRRGL